MISKISAGRVPQSIATTQKQPRTSLQQKNDTVSFAGTQAKSQLKAGLGLLTLASGVVGLSSSINEKINFVQKIANRLDLGSLRAPANIAVEQRDSDDELFENDDTEDTWTVGTSGSESDYSDEASSEPD